VRPGFYKGAVTIQNLGGANGTGILAADVASASDIQAFGRTESQYVTIVKSGSSATLDVGGVISSGDLITTQTGDGFSFVFQDGATIYAFGTLTRNSLPSLGTQISIPPAGNFAGDMTVVSNGVLKGYGPAAATVGSDSTWVAQANGAPAWVGNGTFTGKFETDGTLSNASLIVGGQIYTQGNPSPRYSWDGKTLIVRYDQLVLETGTAWLVLTMQ
jgi:hypothetical protein